MKIVKLILLGSLLISVSCGLEDLGQSDCATHRNNDLDLDEDDYLRAMGFPDSKGNHQSLEVCLNRRDFTEEYLESLENPETEYYEQLEEGCTADEKSKINARINDRKRQLEQDLADVWNDCEKIYGGG